MSVESILAVDNLDPEGRHAGFLDQMDMDLMSDLVKFRKGQKIGQATVAHRMGIDPSGVSKIEAGHRDLLQSTIQRYALAVGAVVEHRVRVFDEADEGSGFSG